MSDSMPSTWEGNNLWKGKKNPVTLVSAVLVRKMAVQPSKRFEANSPNTTTKPEKIPIKLNATCAKVKVVIPKIMIGHLSEAICCCRTVKKATRNVGLAGYASRPCRQARRYIDYVPFAMAGRGGRGSACAPFLWD